MLVIVSQDLLVGVVVGILLSAIKLLYRFSHLELDLHTQGRLAHLQAQIQIYMLPQKDLFVLPVS